MPDQVTLPGGHSVSKRALLLSGAGALGTVGFLYWRNRRASASAPADPGAAVDEQAAIDAAAGGDPFGTSAGAGPSTSSGGGYTSNAQWAQDAIANAINPVEMTAALAVYLTGGPVADGSHTEDLINEARAVNGDPPVAGASGYPPAIRIQPSDGQSGGSAVGTPATPRVTAVSRSSVSLATSTVPGATLYEWVKNGGDHDHTTGPTYTDRSVAPGARYVYAVYAKIGTARGSTSGQVTVTIPK
jgi:hypothetical protein